MRIAFFTPEAVPYAKTGGLADVTGALSRALCEAGHEVIVLMPAYGKIAVSGIAMEKVMPDVSSHSRGGAVFYFLHNERYFGREGFYGSPAGDYPDNLERFAFFCRRGLRLLEQLDFSPDIVHCHDWQAALAAVYLKSLEADNLFFRKSASVLTIHNLAYQGVFPAGDFPSSGLGAGMYSVDAMEFYGKVNLLKGGLIFSDALTTVSPTYSRQIQGEEFGCGLEGILNRRAESLRGILNGLDYSIWDPSRDREIDFNYDFGRMEGKAENKEALRKICGLRSDPGAPLLAVVSRLAEQKGVDLIASLLPEISAKGMQTVILGSGDEKYHRLLGKIAADHPGAVSLHLKFDENLAHKIYAGSDIFLMPSRYEPCGLSQMIALRYGSVPVVSNTGGLADTVSAETGFVMESISREQLSGCVAKAALSYGNAEEWRLLVERGLRCRFSWQAAAGEYVSLYEKVLREK
ncbi:MAG: glycogen synthase GlgA [Candidatus Omnitrophota bacterium]|jgi:starch synthase